MHLGKNAALNIHALRKSFEISEVEAMLLIDAKNAANSLNRNLAFKSTINAPLNS